MGARSWIRKRCRRPVRALERRLGLRARYALKATAGQVTFSILAFGGAVLSARLLGPSGKGALAGWILLATLTPGLFAGSISVGLGRAYLDGRHAEVTSAMVRHGLATFVLCASASLVAAAAGVDPVALIAFVVICIPCGVVYLDFYFIAQAAKLPWLFHVGRVGGALVYAGGLATLLVAHVHRPEHVIWLIYTAGIAVSTGAVLLIFRRRVGSAPGLSLRAAMAQGRRSIWLLAADMVVTRLDQYVVLAVVGTRGLGLYGVAVNWSEITNYVGDAFGQAVFENQATLDDRTVARILQRVVKCLTLVTILVAVSGFVLIPVVFGSAFAPARWTLVLLAPGLIARGLFLVASSVLMGRGRSGDAARITAVVAVGAVLTWTVAAALFGINGTALAASAAYVVQAVMIVPALTCSESGRRGWPMHLAPALGRFGFRAAKGKP